MKKERWMKAAASNNGGGGCVEIRRAADGSVQLADTKESGQGPVLNFDAGEWAAFAQGMRTGEWVSSRGDS